MRFIAEYTHLPEFQDIYRQLPDRKANLALLLDSLISETNFPFERIYSLGNLEEQQNLESILGKFAAIDSNSNNTRISENYSTSYHSRADLFMNDFRMVRSELPDACITGIATSGATSVVYLAENKTAAVAFKKFSTTALVSTDNPRALQHHGRYYVNGINMQSLANNEAYMLSVASLKKYFFRYGEPIFRVEETPANADFNKNIWPVKKIVLQQYKIHNPDAVSPDLDGRFANVVSVEQLLGNHPDQFFDIVEKIIDFQEVAAGEAISMGVDFKPDSFYISVDPENKGQLKVSDLGNFNVMSQPKDYEAQPVSDFCNLVLGDTFLHALLRSTGFGNKDSLATEALVLQLDDTRTAEAFQNRPKVQQIKDAFNQIQKTSPDLYTFLCSAAKTVNNHRGQYGMHFKEGILFREIVNDPSINTFSSLEEIKIALSKLKQE